MQCVARLANQIEWKAAESKFGMLWSEEGRPGISICPMVGLRYLKHTFNLSDEEIVQWVEYPYCNTFVARPTFSVSTAYTDCLQPIGVA